MGPEKHEPPYRMAFCSPDQITLMSGVKDRRFANFQDLAFTIKTSPNHPLKEPSLEEVGKPGRYGEINSDGVLYVTDRAADR